MSKEPISISLNQNLIIELRDEAQLNQMPVSHYVERILKERTTEKKHKLNPTNDIKQIHNIIVIYYNILLTYYEELDKYTKAEQQRVFQENKEITESLAKLTEEQKTEIVRIHKQFTELGCINEALLIDLNNHEAWMRFSKKYPDVKPSAIKKYKLWSEKQQIEDNMS